MLDPRPNIDEYVTYMRKIVSTKEETKMPIPISIPPTAMTTLQPSFLHSKLLRGARRKVKPNAMEATHAVEKMQLQSGNVKGQ